MLSRYLLDTNTASYIIRGSIPAVERRLVKVPIAQIAISAVTEGELRYGVARRPDATRLQTVVDEFLLVQHSATSLTAAHAAAGPVWVFRRQVAGKSVAHREGFCDRRPSNATHP